MSTHFVRPTTHFYFGVSSDTVWIRELVIALHLARQYAEGNMLKAFARGKFAVAVSIVTFILSFLAACSLLNTPPIASFSVSPYSRSAPALVSFDASHSSDSDGIIVSYRWEFGDGVTAAGCEKTHTYELPGLYTATLTVTDEHGAEASTSQAIQINQGSIVTRFVADPTSGEAPLAVDFDASESFDPEGENITYTWSFGDGSTGTGSAVISHTYYEAGIYPVVLTTGNGSGDSGQATATIAVSEQPPEPLPGPDNVSPAAMIMALPTGGYVPLAVVFLGSGSSDSDGSISSYAWSFGDGGNSTGISASHTYTLAGTYTAQLTVTDDAGASDTATVTISVSEQPIIQVTVSANQDAIKVSETRTYEVVSIFGQLTFEATNVSGQDFSDVSIRAQAFDSSGVMIEDSIDMIANVQAGMVFECDMLWFEIDRIVRIDINEINTYSF